MRIISGEKKGIKLNNISKDVTCRPTIDRIKEAIFDIVQFEIEGQALDLFAGTGQMGIEALSRGCENVVFCDNNEHSIKLIKSNIKKTGYENVSEVFFGDYKKYIKQKAQKESFKLIFIDPPFESKLAEKALKAIDENNILRKDGIIVVEAGKNDIIPLNSQKIALKKRYVYGQISVLIYSISDMEGEEIEQKESNLPG